MKLLQPVGSERESEAERRRERQRRRRGGVYWERHYSQSVKDRIPIRSCELGLNSERILGLTQAALTWQSDRLAAEHKQRRGLSHWLTLVTEEEEEEKLSEDTVDVASTQNTAEEMQPISKQTDPSIDLLQDYRGKEPIVCKIKRKRNRKRRPNKTEPVAAAASSEEQPQLEVDVSSTQKTEEEMQPISSQTDSTPQVKTSVTEEEMQPLSIQTDLTLWQTVHQAFVRLKKALTWGWRRMGLLLREMVNGRAGTSST
ncbi:unnamed protein product [Pleuronectes platessa]|uniref:Uncharacterized protein n=1 Tax=Pleuronectes platessa TaxID=8262 RepID=A0A9N7TKT3_PLEPL|nr:unnamed protein product [Pleuronectes platessa]